MILIQYYAPEKLKPYLLAAGIRPDQYSVNGPETPDTKVILKIGGQGVEHTHCYVQTHYRIPIISCLDPTSVYADEMNREWIKLAFKKAWAIDGGKQLHVVSDSDIMIPKKVSEILPLLEAVLTSPYISIDIESTPATSELTCVGFGYFSPDNKLRSLVIPLTHEDQRYWSFEDETEVWKIIAQICSSKKRKLFQNYIFDCLMLSRMGIEVNGEIHDTMTLAHLIQPEWPKGLADLARIYLYCEPWKSLNSWTSNIHLWQYNGRDVINTLRIFLTQYDTAQALYYDLLVPLHTEVLRICERGLVIDESALAKMTAELTAEVAKLTESLQSQAAGLLPPKISYVERRGRIKSGSVYVNAAHMTVAVPPDIKMLKKLPFVVYEKIVDDSPFNPASPQQVKELILALGHKIPTAKSKETTDELALKKLMAKTKHPIYRELLLYREKSKLLNTYCAIELDPDNRLRFQITVPGTVTSRFSSKKTPWKTGCNIQNIPESFRVIVVPSYPDYVIVNIDFKQADPHMVAWLAGEQIMLDIMDSGGDLHAHTASAVTGRDITKDPGYDPKTSIERKAGGKILNNGLMYGMGIGRLADTIFKDLAIVFTEDQARDARNTYFTLYPNIKRWQKEIEQTIYQTRQLTTPFGRVRNFYGPLTYKTVQDALAYIPPTMVADAINIGWLKFIKRAREGSLRVEVLQQCHDSLMMQCHKSDLDKVAELLLQSYNEVTFKIKGITRKFDIDISVGPNWGDLKGYSCSKSLNK